MPQNKTTETSNSIDTFVKSLSDETQRSDSFRLVEIIEEHTGLEPRLWGSSIIGFGRYKYRYDSGHEGETALVGFSPRAAAITLYLSGCLETRKDLLDKLGKHKAGKGCVYVKKLSDIDIEVLKEMITCTINYLKELYPDK